MSKVIDITDKLTFEENPVIRVKDVEIELNADALDIIEVLKASKTATMAESFDLFFDKILASPEDVEKVKSLKLKFKEMNELMGKCIKTIIDSDDEGEEATPAMT